MTDITNKNFKFDDPRKERIYEKLLEVGPGPAAFYIDACRIREQIPPLESNTHLIAHCLREIESSIRDVMLPLDYKQDENSEEKHKDEIRAILSLYEIDLESEVAKLWMRLAGRQEDIALSHLAHRNSLDKPREQGPDFDEFWDGMQAFLDVILSKIEANYLSFITTLDELISKTTVNEKDIKTLKGKIPNSPVTYKYFFERIENLAWLAPLKREGFFKTPPAPIEHPEGGISFPFWPQTIYLKKIATQPEVQSEVLGICVSVKTENVRVQSDLLEIALLLPAEMSNQVIDSVKEIDNFLSPKKYGELIRYLAVNGKIKESVSLANRVLAIQQDPRPVPEFGGHKIPYEPIPIIREYDYEEIIQKDFPDFVDSAGIEAIKVLLDQYKNYIKYTNSEGESGSKDALSEIWRPAIENHSQNHKYGIRDVLITGIRDSCERFLKQHPDQIQSLLKELTTEGSFTFDRIVLHLLRLFPTGSENSVTKYLLNLKEFGDKERLTHEYYLLAEAQASLLTEKQRKTIWLLIEKGGMNKDKYVKRVKEFGREFSEEGYKIHKKNWQLYHLLPFKDLDPQWKKYYEELVAVVGEPEFPSFSSWSSGSSWGYKSSVSDEQFDIMKPGDIVNFLKKWEPPASGDPLDMSREGTSRALSSHITNDPTKWSGTLTHFEDLDPTYVRSVFTAHREALKAGKQFEWKPLLDLSASIVSKPIEIEGRIKAGFHTDDPDWSWSRNALAELLNDGLNDVSGKIPPELREEAWRIIETLTRDPVPSPEEETKQLESHRDPLTLAINSTRGNAMQAVIRYGIWLKSAIPDEERKVWSLSKDAPEVMIVLNNHLDTKKDSSLGTRAIYGEKLGNLCWLDRTWVEKCLNRIFPNNSAEQVYFDVAWETFITFNPAYNDCMPMLRSQYQRAVSEIGKHNNAKHHLENPDQYLAQHLVLFYCRGKIPLDDDLLKEFYSIAPIELKSEVIEFIGRSAKESGMTDEIRNRFITLAENRLAVIKNSKTPHIDVQEFKDFCWWVHSGKFDDKWSLDILKEVLSLGCDTEGEHLILDKYMTLVLKYPLEVITNTESIVENDKKGWGVSTWSEELTNVIKLVLDSNNDEAVIKAREFIQRLVAKGHLQFKDLLTKKDRLE